MATKFVTYRDESKTKYGLPREVLSNGNTASATHEEVNVGSLQRIADACELMATNYIQLQRNEKYWKERAEENEACAKKAQRRIVALKGVITKLKKR